MGVTETSQDQCASCEHSGPNVELSAELETLPASKVYGILARSVCFTGDPSVQTTPGHLTGHSHNAGML